MKTCMHCSEPNPDGWFYCRNCNKPASPRKYTIHTVMRDPAWAPAIRKDLIDFNMISMDKDIENKAAERHQHLHSKIFPKDKKQASIKINSAGH